MSKKPVKVCIVGGVAAGASAAARLRRLDEAAEIVMFERGEYISFANCGLPYHLSGEIADRDELILLTPEEFQNRFKTDVRTRHEVRSIDRERHELIVADLANGREYRESYDKLLLAPGAKPIVPPIPGATPALCKTLRTLPDMDEVLATLKTTEKRKKHVVIIGGGFIGLEAAENLLQAGHEVHLVELAPQVLATLDSEMAELLHEELREHGVRLHLGSSAERIDAGKPSRVQLSTGESLEADLVLFAIGVRPENELAKAAGLELGPGGGIRVLPTLQTNDPDIYAAGDVTESDHFISGQSAVIPLAGPANRQGRIAADHICGLPAEYHGSQGTGIVKVFRLQAATTGINERLAKKIGMPYQAIHLHPGSHAGYYPGATPIALKVLFKPDDGRILGAQAVGRNGADKRIDVLATAIRARLSVFDLQELELSYAPPFGSAKDPVNMAGFVGANIIEGRVRSITPPDANALARPLFVDVRSPGEAARGMIPGAVNIPLDELRSRLSELPTNLPLVLYCAVGIRSYNAYRILTQKGYADVYALSGGFKTYRQYFPPGSGTTHS
ncbi:MAG: FAD-dependent oxidoreductase [Oligoflexia bacterium]|nr:FAD-dependent oxidoreductase [Oligoflexia bacterium]